MIRERDEQQAELLEEYCQALMADPASLPPAGLEPELARASRRLRQQLRAPLPSARFAAALQAQLEEESATPATVNEAEILPSIKPAPRPLRVARATIGWLAAAAVIVLAVAGTLYVASDLANRAERQSLPVQPEAHSAAEIIARAKAMYQSDAVKSFELTEVFTNSGEIKPATITHIFYQTPDRSREEVANYVKIEDSNTSWSYTAPQSSDYNGDVWISRPNQFYSTLIQPVRNNIETLNAALYETDSCYHATLAGTDTIAGRPTYILDLGKPLSGCNDEGPSFNGRHILWLDHDSYFILKDEIYSKDASIQMTTLVTIIQYNQHLDPNLFTFVMPKKVNITDTRPSNAASNDQIRAEAAEAVRGLSFTTYLPTYIPKGLQPGMLTYSTKNDDLNMGYTKFPTTTTTPVMPVFGDYSYPTYPTLQLWRLNVNISPAPPSAIAQATTGLHETTISGEQAWVTTDVGVCKSLRVTITCPPSGSEIVVIRGNSLIKVDGDTSLDELTRVVASLTSLPINAANGPAFPTMPPIPTPIPTPPVEQDGTMP